MSALSVPQRTDARRCLLAGAEAAAFSCPLVNRGARRAVPPFRAPPAGLLVIGAGRSPRLGCGPSLSGQRAADGRASSPVVPPLLPTDRSQMPEAEHLQVFLGAGLALLCLSTFLGCAVCWQHRRRLGPRLGWQRLMVQPGPPPPAGTVPVPVQRHDEEVTAEALGVRPTGGSLSSASPHGGLAHGRASLPTLPSPPQPAGAWQRRCTISGAQPRSEESPLARAVPGPLAPPPSGPDPVQRPRLHCDLFYSPAKATLTVMVLGVSQLPRGLRGGRCSHVRVSLLPQAPASRPVAVRRSSLHTARRQPCRFCCSPERLSSCTLRFALYARLSSLRDSFVGEVLFPCAQATWDPRAPSSYSWELSSTKTKLRKSLSTRDTGHGTLLPQPKSLGQLFLLLQHQAQAGRIKVLVCKAENLGQLSRMPGTPGHYVIIHLYHNGHIIDTKETKSIMGYNPIWNMPFLFSLPGGDIQQQDLSLEFTIMQAHIYGRSSLLGRVQVGPRTPGAGRLHWRDMCSWGQLESARWHHIQPNVLGP
ncbi:synaptotagmin-5-like [Colius striatus]|uniref:synaptotagmin-5-like n=1 Tax=Colius striatus TaxID=57412 RepID=UPI002B1D5370|nr:synaptotagmin-5-like [Colius striatus]